MEALEIYTIGHSNLELERFVDALRRNAIDVVVDTRTSPYSRYVEWANRERLAAELKAAKIGYRFAGGELGGKPADPSLRTSDGAPDYDKIAATPHYRRGIEELIAAASHDRLALLCSEANPMECHRERLIARTLRARGCAVKHIKSDGSLLGEVQGTLF
ncbi:MAG: DUF488 domain-containing protein [Chloroflexi bacterium]|nr:DUF488 domain-containing protein [Chloroflexota bacterium]